MRPRFQADADFNLKIVRGVRRRESVIDFQGAEIGGMIGLPDDEVLMRAAGFERILVSHDRRTMRTAFGRFLQRRHSPGLILVSQKLDIGRAIEDLILIWAVSEAEEWRDRVAYLPL